MEVQYESETMNLNVQIFPTKTFLFSSRENNSKFQILSNLADSPTVLTQELKLIVKISILILFQIK